MRNGADVRRFFRILIKVAMALSLLLCVATTALWIHSCVAPWQTWFGDIKGTVYLVRSASGSLLVQPGRVYSAFGFLIDQEMPQVPYASLFLTTALLPTWWVVRGWMRRKIRPVGACRVCGYDLRATPHRCPECGHPVQK
jgi:hypothetical protein